MKTLIIKIFIPSRPSQKLTLLKSKWDSYVFYSGPTKDIYKKKLTK